MATFKLNGQEIPFEPGDTVIRAAWRAGIEIPHYCWHPGLSVAANCRMCLVHVTSGRQMAMPVLRFDESKKAYVPDTKPKLQPACQLGAAEGMEVDSLSEQVKEAQSAVQEFLLLNHPVDCPICDQAGECKLQDYWLDHQHQLKRKRTEPVHKPKGVRFGPTIVYDAERCIMCTRCIRVCDEVAHDHTLDMRERGNKNEIVLAPGRELSHRYTLMTEHVCPVGALTSRDFRFKARVWFLKSSPGVCTGCATGCNTHVDFDPRYGKIYRLRPRDNEAVNKFWMCDDGMMTYQTAHERRIKSAWVGRGNNRQPALVTDALVSLVQGLQGVDRSKIGVVLSAQHTTEDNYVMARLASLLGTKKLYLAARGGWEGDDILRHADNNPNRAGAQHSASIIAGLTNSPEGPLETVEDLTQDALAGEVEAVIVLGSVADLEDEQLAPLRALPLVAAFGSNDGPLSAAASFVIPVAGWAEVDGTFINAQGMRQSFRPAVPPPAGVEPAWRTIQVLAAGLGLPLSYANVAAVRSDVFAPPASNSVRPQPAVGG